MKRHELIKKYLDFFKSKGHKIIPSGSLVPENDPTVLFTTAGMHPLVPYLLGQQHSLGRRLANVQKCIRTTDIDEVGDETHHTFFEMLGNWSLGDYFKKEAIEMSFEFLTKILKIPAERLAVSVFAGDDDAPRDLEAANTWLKLGIPKSRVAFLGKEDNWWGPAGLTGPCGPDTEMFYWKSKKEKPPKTFDPKDNNWVEIWNDVLMQYVKDENGNYKEAKQKNVDTGMGVERTVAVLNGLEDNYLTDLWHPIIKEIEKLSVKKYSVAKHNDENITKAMRIIADHIRASVFIIASGILPSNTERGYVLRRLIRRAVRYARELRMKNFTKQVAAHVFQMYDVDYPELRNNEKQILSELENEENRFLETIERGMKIFQELVKNKKALSGKEAFLLYQSFGFPLEMIVEECKNRKIKFNEKDFFAEENKHKELSRSTSKGKFAAGLADHSIESTRYHTATHMLHKALKLVLGQEVQQMGSNITPERMRFDFSFPRKLTNEELKKIESVVNREINRGLKVSFVEMPYAQAVKTGALSYFRERYPPIVKVYSVGDFSKEICTGPHVKNTKEIGKFKIIKEESVAQGVRRIKAVLE
ncbi:alanine--tRNA ligase [Candidatus Pacearchaeota archaeon]|nr:alanine--tRNA ligase [Candidatus Pacearchaeota archaeon]